MKLPRTLYTQIIEQAKRELPNEACGYLLGTDANNLLEAYPMTNADASPEHFSFVPREQFAALNRARQLGAKLVANWHSHPSSPSRPSVEDIRLAYDPSIAYLILSLAEKDPVLKAFKIVDGQVEQLPLEVVG